MKRQKNRRLALGGLLVWGGIVAFTSSGCKKLEHLESTGTDDAYIRAPGETSGPQMPRGSLLPLQHGTRWTMATLTGKRSEMQDAKPATEEISVGKVMTLGKATGVALDIRQNGKLTRQEVFKEQADGLYFVGAGASDKMEISPPICLVKYPVKDGEAVTWSGILRFKGTNAPGTAFSRVSARDTVKLPGGTFPVWRVDTVISTTVEGAQVAFPTVRYFSPGIGIVKQKTLAGETLLEKQMVRYQKGG